MKTSKDMVKLIWRCINNISKMKWQWLKKFQKTGKKSKVCSPKPQICLEPLTKIKTKLNKTMTGIFIPFSNVSN